MAKSNKQEEDYLKLIFNNTPIANIGDTSGIQPSATAGNLYVALYTTDPTDADTGTEATYGGYQRVEVARTTGEWSVSGNVVTNVNEIAFPQSTGTNNTITHIGIRTASTGGDLLFHGQLDQSILVEIDDTPKIQGGDLQLTES